MKLAHAVLALAAIVAAPAAGLAQPIRDDYSEQVVHVLITAGCASYTWPVGTTAGSVGRTKWHDIAVTEICKQYGSRALAFDVRGDGRIIALNQADFADDRYFPDAYGAAQFIQAPVHFTIDGSGKVTLTPKGIEKDIPNAVADLALLRRQAQFLASQNYVKPTDVVVDVTVGTDQSVTWAGIADPNQQQARQTALQLCLRHVWDLPFERHMMCGARVAFLALNPR